MDKETKDQANDLIQDKIKQGFMSEKEIANYVVMELESEIDDDEPEQGESSKEAGTQKDTLSQEVSDLVAKHFSRQKKIEAAWTAATDCDKLDWVFSYLEATGVAARQNFGCCGNLLGLFSSKYQATVIKCLNKDCTFMQEATADDIAVEVHIFSQR